MGISGKLLTEGPVPLPKPLIKQLLKYSDDVSVSLKKLFNLSDNQIDGVIRKIDTDGIDKISDDVLELLSKASIDNVDDLVTLMKAGKMFGSNFDEIALSIFARADNMVEISMTNRNKIVKYYSDKLDELPYLEGADEIKSKLLRDFQSEFDSKFADKLARLTSSALDKELDDLFTQSDEIMGELNNIVNGMPLNTPGRQKTQTAWKRIFYNKENAYDEIKRRAGYINAKEYKRAGNIGGMKEAEIERLLGKVNNVDIDPKDKELVYAVSAAQNANYFTAANSSFMKLPKMVQYAFWTTLLTGGTAFTLGTSIIKILIGLLEVGSEKLDTINVTTDLISLSEDKIIEHLSTKLGVPIETIEDWVIVISQDKKTATAEDPAVNGKIYQIKLNEVEDEPESNTITSTEA